MKTPVQDRSKNTNMPNVTLLTMKERTDDYAPINTTEVKGASVTASQTASMVCDETRIQKNITSDCISRLHMMSGDDKKGL